MYFEEKLRYGNFKVLIGLVKNTLCNSLFFSYSTFNSIACAEIDDKSEVQLIEDAFNSSSYFFFFINLDFSVFDLLCMLLSNIGNYESLKYFRL